MRLIYTPLIHSILKPPGEASHDQMIRKSPPENHGGSTESQWHFSNRLAVGYTPFRFSSCFPISNRPQISPNGSNNIYIATSSIFHCFPTCPVKEQPLGDPNRGPVLLRGVLEPNGYDTDLMVGVHRASKHRECPARVEGPLISNFYACFVISPTWTVCNSMVQLCTARQDLRGVLIWATPLTLVNSASSGKCM